MQENLKLFLGPMVSKNLCVLLFRLRFHRSLMETHPLQLTSLCHGKKDCDELKASRLSLLMNIDLSLHETKTDKETHKELEEQGNTGCPRTGWFFGLGHSLMDTEGSDGASRLVTTQITC